MRVLSAGAAAVLAICLSACASSSGAPAAGIAQPAIAAAYLPLEGRVHLGLDLAEGAGVVIAPGIAVTNAHNANLVDPGSVIGTVPGYDMMFFRTARTAAPPTAVPRPGMEVTAYGQGVNGGLRVAHGVVRHIQICAGCVVPAWFTFSNDKRGAGDAGPGFSGGPVLDGDGRLVGITFGYKDAGGQRLIYAYDMGRVRTALSAFQKGAK